MVYVIDTESGVRIPEMEPQSYADEVMLAGWTEVPGITTEVPDWRCAVLPRLAERESERHKPSPFADPDFIARIYRSQG